jgi:hypothetical protein
LIQSIKAKAKVWLLFLLCLSEKQRPKGKNQKAKGLASLPFGQALFLLRGLSIGSILKLPQ